MREFTFVVVAAATLAGVVGVDRFFYEWEQDQGRHLFVMNTVIERSRQ